MQEIIKTITDGYENVLPLRRVRHEYRSFSLNETEDISELIEWIGDRECVLSWEYDGLAVILTYDNGKLVQAATRGDGDIGEDITRNAVNFKNVPLTINDTRHIVIQGELVISYKTFNSINAKLPQYEKYENPRNMTARAARALTPDMTAEFHVTFIPIELMNARELGINRYSRGLDFIDGLGLCPVNWTLVNAANVTMVISKREEQITGGVLIYPTYEIGRAHV